MKVAAFFTPLLVFENENTTLEMRIIFLTRYQRVILWQRRFRLLISKRFEN